MKKYYYLCTLLFLSISTANAGGLSSSVDDKNQVPSGWLSKIASTWVATVSFGPVWENSGTTQTFFLAPGIEKTYVADKSFHALPEGELFLGIQKLLPKQLVGQLGLLVATTGNAILSGDVWDDADSNFNNYTYTYKVKNTRVSIKGKVLADKGYIVAPWISGSIGVGFNQAHNFTNTPTLEQAVAISNFTNNTTTALTYTLGAGIQRYIDNHCQVGIGYEFADWGKSQLGRQSSQILNSGPAMNHLYTNGFLVNLTYVA